MTLYKRLKSPTKEQEHSAFPTWALVAAVAAFVIGSGFLVNSIVLRITGDRSTEFCTSPGCTEYAKVLSDTIDTTADPCHSFDAYVCTGWRATHAFSVRTWVMSRALQGMIESIGKDTDLPPGNQSFLQKVSLLYLSCDNVRHEGNDQVPLIRKLLRAAGIVWPRRSSEPNVIHTLIYLSLELDWSVVIKVSAMGHSVQIDPAVSFWLALKEEEQKRTQTTRRYQNFELLKAHFSKGSNEATIDFNFTDALERAFLEGPGRGLIGILAFSYDNKEGSLEQIPLGSLREREWVRTLAHFNVTAPQEFRTTNLEFVQAFLKLYEHFGESDTHLFISWMAVRFTSMFANPELISNHYDSGNPNMIRYRHGRWCYRLAYKFIGDLLFAPYNVFLYPPTVENDVERLVLAVRSELATRLSTRLPYAADSSLAIEWSSLDTALSALNVGRLGSKNSSALARGLPNMTRSLVTNWHAMWKTVGTGKERLFVRTFGQDQELSFATYSASQGDFVLAPHVLTFPIYDVGLVDAVKFGAFGGIVATAASNLAFIHYRKTNGTSSAVKDALTCVKTYSLPWQAARIVKSIASLDIAAAAFRDHGSPRVIKNAIHLTPMQLLFISWCYLRCPGGSEEQTFRCDSTVQHVPEFSRAFKCDGKTPLNPPRKCRLF